MQRKVRLRQESKFAPKEIRFTKVEERPGGIMIRGGEHVMFDGETSPAPFPTSYCPKCRYAVYTREEIL